LNLYLKTYCEASKNELERELEIVKQENAQQQQNFD
jgi:hypothetical protein